MTEIYNMPWPLIYTIDLFKEEKEDKDSRKVKSAKSQREKVCWYHFFLNCIFEWH